MRRPSPSSLTFLNPFHVHLYCHAIWLHRSLIGSGEGELLLQLLHCCCCWDSRRRLSLPPSSRSSIDHSLPQLGSCCCSCSSPFLSPPLSQLFRMREASSLTFSELSAFSLADKKRFFLCFQLEIRLFLLKKKCRSAPSRRSASAAMPSRAAPWATPTSTSTRRWTRPQVRWVWPRGRERKKKEVE